MMTRVVRHPSVRAWVVAAACVVAAMTLVAGAVTWVFYARIELLLVTVSEEQSTTIAQALKLAEACNRYAAGAGEIDDARTQLQRQNAAVALGQHAYALRELIGVLRRSDLDPGQIDAIEGQVQALEDTLARQNERVEQRIDLEARARRQGAEAGRVLTALDALLAESDRALAVGTPERHALETAGGRMMLRLFDAGQADRPASLQAARSDFDAARRRLLAAADSLPDGLGEWAWLHGLVQRMDALGTGPSGIFPQREATLRIRAEIDRHGARVRQLVTLLGIAATQLVTTAEGRAEQTKRAVSDQIDAGRRWLLLVAAATFLGPVAFVWLAVGRTVARPLARLAEATRRIAEGDLHAPIPPARHREFQAIGEALAVFRDNTAALAERTAALQRSEDAHRHAREQAERALEDLRETQEQLIQSEKMAALAGVVAGVAHEINTPIGITLTSATLLADEVKSVVRLSADGRLKRTDFERFLRQAQDTAALIESNINRASNLVRAFKQVSTDQSSGQRRVFDLDEVLEQTVISIRPACDKAGHAVRLDCPAGLVLDSYPGPLSQVLTILIMNSLSHAFEPGQRGEMVISAAPEPGGPESAKMVRIGYRDDGCGILPELHRKVFEPFFTTRRGLGNTGLGLHIAFNIIRQALMGHLELVPPEEGGVHFAIRIPMTAPRSEQA